MTNEEPEWFEEVTKLRKENTRLKAEIYQLRKQSTKRSNSCFLGFLGLFLIVVLAGVAVLTFVLPSFRNLQTHSQGVTHAYTLWKVRDYLEYHRDKQGSFPAELSAQSAFWDEFGLNFPPPEASFRYEFGQEQAAVALEFTKGPLKGNTLLLHLVCKDKSCNGKVTSPNPELNVSLTD